MGDNVFTIWGNAEFGCEIAYFTAKYTDKSILLIDADFLSPSVDLHIGVEKYPKEINLKGSSTSYDILCNAVQENYISSEIIYNAAIKMKYNKNLFVITGSYNIYDYEYYSRDVFEKILDKCRQCFDVIFLLVNKSIYDMATLVSLHVSDINIIATRAITLDIREYNNYIDFLSVKQGFPESKFKFVAFEYNRDIMESTGVIKEITKDSFIGVVRHSKLRDKARVEKKPFCSNMDTKTIGDYKILLNKLGFIPKLTIKEKMLIKLGFTKYENIGLPGDFSK